MGKQSTSMDTRSDVAASKRNVVNLDWTRDPPPLRMTPYQRCIRDIDWSKTSLGPMRLWRRELRQIVLFMMAEVDPVILCWDEHNTIIYNEAYVPLVGKKHLQLQGMGTPDAFPEFWSRFSDVIDEQRLTGETRMGETSMLLIERHGFLEETYFDWRLIPVISDDGVMLGSYGRPSESTHEVINARRVACIQALAQHTSCTNSFDDLWKGVMIGLNENEKDVPIAMLYASEQTRGALDNVAPILELQALLGIPTGHACAKPRLDLRLDKDGLTALMLKAWSAGEIVAASLTNLGLQHLFDNIEWRGLGKRVDEIVLLPIRAEGATAAVLLLGVNPYQRFTKIYQEFVEMIQNALSYQMSKLKLARDLISKDQRTNHIMPAFQQSEVKFARFAERSPLGLMLTNSYGKVMYANEAWCKFCGLILDDIEAKDWIETIHEDDRELINEWWHRAMSSKESGTFQIRSKEPFKSGHMELPYRTGIVAVYPDLDDEGNVTSVMRLITDISELKWTEEQLRIRQREIEESEKKYRDFAEHAPIGVIRTDTRGYVQFANDTWRSFYNFDREHKFVEPEPWLTSLNKEDIPSASQYFKDISATGITKSVEVRLQRRKDTLDDRRATPAEFWLLATGFAEFNPDGSVNTINFWVTDISDQKAAEKILTDKMEEAIRLKITQERFVDMISHEIRNPLSAILHCSEEIVEAMTGLSSIQSLLQRKPSSSGATNTSLVVQNYISSALDAANVILYCVQHQKQIVDDVLTLSKLDADLLVVSPVPVQPSELMRSALKIFEPELKASMIELAFDTGSSLERFGVDWIMLDTNRFLQIVINLVSNAIKFTRNSETRRIVVSVNVGHDRLSRLHEGVHYVPQREIDRNNDEGLPENGIHQTTPDDLYLCVSVTDTGKGLTEIERMTLFNRFAQASPKTHIEYGGSGLGLFIARQITEMLGGEIGVGSEPGKGATFAFYVRTRKTQAPRRVSTSIDHNKTTLAPIPGAWATGTTEKTGEPPEKKAVRDTASPSTGSGPSHQSHILVVEDNLVNQRVLCKQLRNRKFLVSTANHGREALDVLERTENDISAVRFDVILCDIEMPIMGGIECVKTIRRLEKEGVLKGHIPIIGVTANVRSEQVDAAIAVGMDGVTTKPYRIHELVAHIERLLEDVKK